MRTAGTLSKTVNSTWKNFLASPLVAQYLESIVVEVRQRVQAAIDQKPELIQQILARWMELISNGLKDSEQLRTALNSLIERMARGLANNYSAEISNLISETVKSWDAFTLTEKIEDQVGADLQYIRVNGTVVGGLLGLLIYALELLLA